MNGIFIKGAALWLVIQFHATVCTPIHTPSSEDDATQHEIVDLWAELCGWKEMSSKSTDQVVSKLRDAVGSVDGVISVSCNEDAQPVELEKPDARSVQNQVIFVEIPDPMVVYQPPPPPRVVIYVLPPEESHVFNILDMREFKAKPPTVHFLSGNGIEDQYNQRLARGVVGKNSHDDFEIIPAINYWGDSQAVE